MSAKARLRIGITIGLHVPGESLWNNGIKQNAIYLARTLALCPNVASVCLVNTTAVPITPDLPWNQHELPTVPFDDTRDRLDVLIELGGQVDAERTAYLKGRGTYLVSYCCGFEYIMAMESIIFGRPLWGYNLFVNQRYDALWVIPQVAPNSLHFFQTLRRLPARVVPFVWDPHLLRARSAALLHQGEYRPSAGPRRLTVMEPNHDVVKFCLYPVLIAEEAYRRRPQDIALLQVTNAETLARTSKEFVVFMNHLEIVRGHRAVFLGRHDTPQFLAEQTDAVISHQWDNALNYFYLEVCWQGYPLVHNATLCRELGYYYEGNDVQAGCAELLRAMDTHDSAWEDYRARQRGAIQRFLSDDPANVRAYGELLGDLVRQPLR